MSHSTPVCRPLYADRSIDELIHRVLGLHPSQLWHFFDRLTGHPKISAVGWRISERRKSQRRNAQRDAEMVRLHDGGLSYDDISRVYNLKTCTVRRACQRWRVRKKQSDNESLSLFYPPYDS
jgi:hypothetical protein